MKFLNNAYKNKFKNQIKKQMNKINKIQVIFI